MTDERHPARRRPRPRPGLLLAVIVALLGAAAVARAQSAPDVARVRRQYTQAIELMRQREWQAAIALLEAPELAGFKNVVWNRAECQRQLGRAAAAASTLRRYLAHPRVTADEAQQARQELAQLARLVARLHLRANASRLTILVDGEERGQIPVDLELDPGRHVIEIAATHYEPWRQSIDLAAGQKRTVEATLVLRPAEVSIVTRPEGARVTIGGQPVPTAPGGQAVALVSPGSHRLAVSLAGHRQELRQLGLDPGQKLRLEVALTEQVASLVVLSNQPRSTVYLGERALGQTPLTLPRLAPGNHLLRIEKKGFQPWAVPVGLHDRDAGRVGAHLRRGALSRRWFLIAAATAVAGLVTGPILLAQARNRAADFQRGLTRLGRPMVPFGQLQMDRASADASGGQSDQLHGAGLGLVITGGTAAATAALLALFTRWTPSSGTVEVAPATEAAHP